MKVFERRAPQVEAIKYTGGLEAAEEVMGWLYVRGWNAAYQPALLDDGQTVRREGVVYWNQRDINSRIRALRPKMWLVNDPESDLHDLTDGEFELIYKEVPDEGARPE